MAISYLSDPDPDLEVYWLALSDCSFNPNSTSFEVLKQRYLRLNDKWRNELLRTLWALRDELDTHSLTWNVFSHLYNQFDLNPNSITQLEIDQLFEWVNN